MRRAPCPIAVLLATAGALAGCEGLERFFSSVEFITTSSIDAIAYRYANDEPVLFNVSGPIAIDVQSFGGDVTVIVDPELEHLTVTVTRRAIHGFGRREEADASLQQITWEGTVVPGTLGQALEIRTATAHAEPHFQRVDILIEAPEVDALFVRTHNGRVEARDIRGPVDIETDDGAVRVMTTLPLVEPVSIVTVAGDIDYRVRGNSTAALDCRAVRGRVSHRTLQGRVIVHAGTKHDTLRATLNNGTNPVKLLATDGDVRVAIVDEPTRVGQFIVD